MKLFRYINLLSFFLLSIGCAPTEDKLDALLTQEEKDYVERFNVTAKDIRDFPPQGKNLEKYFYVFKSVPNIENAKIIFFGEQHDHAGNRLWTAGTINRLIRANDVVLFEGAQAGTPIHNVSEHLVARIFATREYEKLKVHKEYVPTAISKMEGKFLRLFYKTKNFLALDILNLDTGRGVYWDLKQGDTLHPDGTKRNETMVQTIKDNLKGDVRVFVIAGAMHIPHYEFAYFINSEMMLDFSFTNFTAHPGAKKDEINDAFYDYFSTARRAETKSIFEFLKDKDFAVLIPKNIPDVKRFENYFPKNAR